MSLANLTDLKTAIAEWLYRTGDTALAARADDFITLFEADFTIDPENRTEEMQEVDTAPVTTANVALPNGYLDMVDLKLTGVTGVADTPLKYVTPAQAAVLDATTQTSGTPKAYTIKAGQIFICPARWVSSGTLEMTYYKFSPLSAGVNWLLQKYPNLYLYGSLMQAAAYVDDEDTVRKWKAGRDEALAKLSKTNLKRRVGAGPLVVGASSSFIR